MVFKMEENLNSEIECIICEDQCSSLRDLKQHLSTAHKVWIRINTFKLMFIRLGLLYDKKLFMSFFYISDNEGETAHLCEGVGGRESFKEEKL